MGRHQAHEIKNFFMRSSEARAPAAVRNAAIPAQPTMGRRGLPRRFAPRNDNMGALGIPACARMTIGLDCFVTSFLAMTGYFPMQNLEKILSRTWSVLTWPVIWPRL